METEAKNKLGYKAGLASLVVNLILFIFKYWAGVISGSIALIADAWHTLSDSLTSIIVIFSIKISSKKANSKHPFGYGRWEQISAIFIALILAIVAYEFGKSSIDKLYTREAANFGIWALIVTIASIAIKEGLAQYTFYVARKTENLSIKADAWHHRSDALSSVIVLIGILLKDYFWWIDGALGLCISAMLLYVVYDIIKNAITKILGEEIDSELETKIKKIIDDTSETDVTPHHFHIHNYGNHKELTFHIVLDDKIELGKAHVLIEKIEKNIKAELNIEATIHPDPKSLPAD